jgi:hypothetical protein
MTSTIEPSKLATTTTLNTGIGANVLLSFGERRKQDLSVETFTVPQFLENGPVEFTIRIKNKSMQLAEAKGEISIRNVFGQLVARLPLESSYILGKTTRRLTTNSSGTALWPEAFLLGPYKATLTMTNAANNKPLESSIQFYAFPLMNFLKLTAVLIVLIFVMKRVKHQLK